MKNVMMSNDLMMSQLHPGVPALAVAAENPNGTQPIIMQLVAGSVFLVFLFVCFFSVGGSFWVRSEREKQGHTQPL